MKQHTQLCEQRTKREPSGTPSLQWGAAAAVVVAAGAAAAAAAAASGQAFAFLGFRMTTLDGYRT